MWLVLVSAVGKLNVMSYQSRVESFRELTVYCGGLSADDTLPAGVCLHFMGRTKRDYKRQNSCSVFTFHINGNVFFVEAAPLVKD